MARIPWCAVCLLAAAAVNARTITTIIDRSGDGGGRLLSVASAIAVDEFGNVYVGGANSDNVFRITPDGDITEIIQASGDSAGNGLDLVRGIVADAAGNVYVAAEFSDNAFKIDTPTACSTSTTPCAISELIDASGDGAGHALDGTGGIAVDDAGNVYVVGRDSDNAFKITPAGVITEILDATGDGAGRALDLPQDVEVDGAGNVYVMGHLSANVFKIDSPGRCSTSSTPCSIGEIIDGTGDGDGNALRGPRDTAVDASANVYVTGDISHNAFRITPGGTITEVIDGSGDRAGHPLDTAAGVATDGAGNVYVTGFDSDNAFAIDTPGPCSTIATPCTITEIIDAAGDGKGAALDAVVRIAAQGTGPSRIYIPGFLSNNAFEIDTNEPPVALCRDSTIATDANCLSSIGVADIDDGSSDPDGPGDIDSLCITAIDGSSVPCLDEVELIDDLGAHTLTLTITDLAGASDSCDAAIDVIDDISPHVICSVEKDSLWPPNRKMVDVGLSITVTDNCDAAPTSAIEVTSDEHMEYEPPGNGFCPDAEIDGGSVGLRAERDGSLDGRVYVVGVTVTDGSGNDATCDALVETRHSRKVPAGDSGQDVDATRCSD